MTTPVQLQRQQHTEQEGINVRTTVLGRGELDVDPAGNSPDSGGNRPYPCQRHPADLWFAELPVEVEEAKSLCGSCPIRRDCLQGALQRSEPWGVWGGQLLVQGVIVPRKRPRGRPRKNEIAA